MKTKKLLLIDNVGMFDDKLIKKSCTLTADDEVYLMLKRLKKKGLNVEDPKKWKKEHKETMTL